MAIKRQEEARNYKISKITHIPFTYCAQHRWISLIITFEMPTCPSAHSLHHTSDVSFIPFYVSHCHFTVLGQNHNSFPWFSAQSTSCERKSGKFKIFCLKFWSPWQFVEGLGWGWMLVVHRSAAPGNQQIVWHRYSGQWSTILSSCWIVPEIVFVQNVSI